jgi:hypothetical protein
MISLVRRVAAIQCANCGRPWLDPDERWRSYVDIEGEVVAFCPERARREFDDDQDEGD